MEARMAAVEQKIEVLEATTELRLKAIEEQGRAITKFQWAIMLGIAMAIVTNVVGMA